MMKPKQSARCCWSQLLSCEAAAVPVLLLACAARTWGGREMGGGVSGFIANLSVVAAYCCCDFWMVLRAAQADQPCFLLLGVQCSWAKPLLYCESSV